jgi:hypothetical protein
LGVGERADPPLVQGWNFKYEAVRNRMLTVLLQMFGRAAVVI